MATAFGNALGGSIADQLSEPSVPPPASADEKAAILDMFEGGLGGSGDDGIFDLAGGGSTYGVLKAGSEMGFKLSDDATGTWSDQVDKAIREASVRSATPPVPGSAGFDDGGASWLDTIKHATGDADAAYGTGEEWQMFPTAGRAGRQMLSDGSYIEKGPEGLRLVHPDGTFDDLRSRPQAGGDAFTSGIKNGLNGVDGLPSQAPEDPSNSMGLKIAKRAAGMKPMDVANFLGKVASVSEALQEGAKTVSDNLKGKPESGALSTGPIGKSVGKIAGTAINVELGALDTETWTGVANAMASKSISDLYTAGKIDEFGFLDMRSLLSKGNYGELIKMIDEARKR